MRETEPTVGLRERIQEQTEMFQAVNLPHRPTRFVPKVGFFAPPVKTVEERLMSRKDDPQTSQDAARRVAGHVSLLQAEVLQAFKEFGPMTAGECEKLARFDHCGFSTIRKRCSELAKAGHLVATGERRDGMTVWRIAG